MPTKRDTKFSMLTVKQSRLFKYLVGYIKENEICPSFDEMRKFMNLKSRSGIHSLLGRIEWKGYIKKHPLVWRTIEITKIGTND